ncbi:MAG: hypothetical protein QOC99_810 [Acidobacteriota bacterium]|jgi:hypothetical protein|nr:hypothetical protein [Acidobacteriota bacterium]
MKKLAGLLAFAIALTGAILLTKYYSQPAAPAPPNPALSGGPTAPTAPNGPDSAAHGNEPVTFKSQLVTLDLAGRKAHITLALERDPAHAAPATVWVWAYFFSTDATGKYCAGEPVEVRQPFASGGGRANVTVDIPVADCPAPRAPSSTYYARINISTESAFAARLGEQRISYDITQASPVVLEGAQGKKR